MYYLTVSGLFPASSGAPRFDKRLFRLAGAAIGICDKSHKYGTIIA